MKHLFHRILPFLMLTLSFSGKGQIPTNQDCLGAIPVCQQIYSETLSPSGDGNYNNEINTSISCTAGELNSIWYTFTVDQSGNFGFLLTPNDINDDYDWSLFNITTASCEDIFSNQNLIVSCNAAGGGTCDGLTGATGGTNFDIQGAGCGVNPPTISNALTAFNDLIPVIAGNTYVLMVSNWTGSPNGYTLDFGLSTGIGIFDEQPPMLETISGPVSCGGQDIDIEFSEYINCTTIDASNFQLTGPGGPYTLSLDGNGCDNSANFENSFSLIIDPPISSMGTFTLSINSTGAFPLEDLCGNPIGQATADFDVDVPIPCFRQYRKRHLHPLRRTNAFAQRHDPGLHLCLAGRFHQPHIFRNPAGHLLRDPYECLRFGQRLYRGGLPAGTSANRARSDPKSLWERNGFAGCEQPFLHLHLAGWVYGPHLNRFPGGPLRRDRDQCLRNDPRPGLHQRHTPYRPGPGWRSEPLFGGFCVAGRHQ
ncbi:MAG: hypothetical protein IPJ00_03775 [Saprospirales bacterium]|nr:hypothetical protein [Saprospirales bacterium]